MPSQLYHANVAFGANITGYFVIQAGSLQEAAALAVKAYDQNTAVQLANGDTRTRGNTAGIVNNLANTGAAVTVYVKNPTEGLANAWQLTVQAAAITPPTLATYTANGIGAAYSTIGA